MSPIRVQPIRRVEPADLDRLLSTSGATVVDSRPIAAFNGWRLADEPRGGHLPGAIALPSGWLAHLEEREVWSILAAHRVPSIRPIVVYGYGHSDATAVASRLAELGFDAGTLTGGWASLVADPRREIDALPNYERLVHPTWLRALLDGGRPEAAPADRLLVLHVSFGVPAEYAEGHLPGALYLDTNWLEDPVDWNRRSAAELEAVLTGLGITPSTTVVLYGRDTEGAANEKWPGRRAGQIAAARAALILRYAGVDDVRLLDGGYDRWVREGHPLETVDRAPVPVSSFGVQIPQRPELLVDIDEAKDILANPDRAALVSVRTWKEHIGAVSGYNYIGPAGRIAGDVWGNCGSDAYHMQHYRTVENGMRPYPEIAANWADAGIAPDKRIAFYCGTGWRASETWFYAYLMGWSRIAVYDGGWFEWSQDPVNNPIEVGAPDDEVAA